MNPISRSSGWVDMIHAADPALGPTGTLTARWRDTSFHLRYQTVRAEDGRRSRLGLGAITDPAILATALSVPAGEIGPLHCNTGTTIDGVVGSGLVGAVRDLDGAVWGYRLGGAALVPVEAIISARRLIDGLHRAERIAGYAPRTVLLPAGSNPSPALLTEAAHYGVGVSRGDSVGVREQIVASGPWTVERPSPEWWLFLEEMYRIHLDQSQHERGQFTSLNQFSISGRGLSLGF